MYMHLGTLAWLVGVHDELVVPRTGIDGWGTGWVYRRGNTGSTQLPARRSYTSGAGPVRPCRGLEWVGVGPGASELQGPPLPAVGPAPLSLYLSPSKCRLLANNGEI